MNKETSLLAFLVVLVIILAGIYVIFPQSAVSPQGTETQIKRFSSYAELQNFVNSSTASYRYGGGTFGALTGTATTALPTAVAEQATKSTNAPTVSGSSAVYSQTNVQVEGVDEPDIVKNDGKYIYIVSGNKVVIVDAYPADNAKIISQIEFNGTPQQIFVNGDKLIVFGGENDYSYSGVATPGIATTAIASAPMYPYYGSSKTFIMVYDITDRSNPILKRNVSVDGSYYDSRMIGDYVYAIANQPVYFNEPHPIPMPVITSNGVERTVPATDIYYFDLPDSSYVFTNVISVNTQNDIEDVTSKTFLTGYSDNMYVSANNIYLVYTKWYSEADYYDKIVDEAIMPNVPAYVQSNITSIRNSNEDKYQKMNDIENVVQDYVQSLGPEEGATVMKNLQNSMATVEQEIQKDLQKTVISKISVSNGDIEFKASGEVPGTVLNQFSMDENNGYFRIATTISGYYNNQDTSTNNMYVLDDGMNITGRLENVAPSESIYAVRFIGDRAYMVTFNHIDPLTVIDLSDPTNPKVLGELKIPGYTDYLQPYDETHLIGIGKDVNASIDAEKIHTQGAVYYTAIQGVKISIFDVSDVSNPVEMYKEVIGDRGTESLATTDHKALLFDKEKDLLVVPMTVAELAPGQPNDMEGQVDFIGAYVYNITLQDGLKLMGRITHNESSNLTNGYYYGSPFDIKRSLFIDNTLYTLSDEMIKVNNLNGLSEISSVQLPYVQEEYVYPYVR